MASSSRKKKSSFWKNLDEAREKAGIERKAIERECNLANNAFTQGKKRGSSPSIDLAYLLAKAVGVTMEELADEQTGLEYVLEIVRNKSKIVNVPERIRPIVECLLLLDDRELRAILANVKELASDKPKPLKKPLLSGKKQKLWE